MKSSSRVLRLIVAAGMSAAIALACSSCSAVSTASNSAPSRPPAGAEHGLFTALPAGIRDKGYVVVATNPMYPPFETLSANQHTIQGLDPDLLSAMAKKIGIKVRFQQAGFDTLIPGLQAHRYDMAMSGMTDTAARERQVRFVDYFEVGGGIVMNAHDPVAAGSIPTALCGKQVGVGIGTITVKMSQNASVTCTAEGRPPLDVQNFPSVSAAVLALSSGRIGYVWTDSVSAATQAEKSDGRFISISDGTAAEPDGIVFPKDAVALCKVFQSALQAIIDDGTYGKILGAYGLASGGVQTARVDGGRG